MLNIGSHLSISKGFYAIGKERFQSVQTHFNFLHATLVAVRHEELMQKMLTHLLNLCQKIILRKFLPTHRTQ